MRRIAFGLVLAGVLALAQGASAYTSDLPTSADNPLAGKRWFVDWEGGLAQRQFLAYAAHAPPDKKERAVMAKRDPVGMVSRVRPEDQPKAQLMLKLARNPQTKRFGHWTKAPGHEVRAYVERMHRTDPNAYPFFYLYRLSHKGCILRRTWSGFHDPRFAGERPAEAKRYLTWIDDFASGLGQQPATIFLEPDGLATMGCLPRHARATRYWLIRYAIALLSRNPNVTIYLDGGASDWLPARTMARRLAAAGVGATRGFFLNSTHYDWTFNNLRYGDRVSRLLGGKHYVISTAVNGRGPFRVRRRKRYFNELRCNPPGRALGEEPTVRTGSIWADAYFWIGDPGRSGSNRCPHAGQPKAPPAGQWWEWYALDLAQRAGWP